MEISKDYAWNIRYLTNKELKTLIENLNLTPTNCSTWLYEIRNSPKSVKAHKHLIYSSKLWELSRIPKKPVKNAKKLFKEDVLPIKLTLEDQILEYTVESYDEILRKEFYYNKSKHGDNFYQILKKLPVKNEYHDWEDYYLYKQCGTGLEFLKPIEMFNKEFKKVRIDD